MSKQQITVCTGMNGHSHCGFFADGMRTSVHRELVRTGRFDPSPACPFSLDQA